MLQLTQQQNGYQKNREWNAARGDVSGSFAIYFPGAMISPRVSYRCVMRFPLIMVLIELSDQRGERATEEDLWLLLAISYGIVSLLMFEQGSSEHGGASCAPKNNIGPWFLSVIWYNSHKLNHEVHWYWDWSLWDLTGNDSHT